MSLSKKQFWSQLEDICRDATQCRRCFQPESGYGLSAPLIDIAQPRLVGSRYPESNPRIVIIAINPGAGGGKHDAANTRSRDLIRLFRSGEGELEAVFDHQRREMRNWDSYSGGFEHFYTEGLGLGLSIEDLAFVNLAWCATLGNKYPTTMLRECIGRHTAPLLEILEPDVMLLSGTKTWGMRGELGAICNDALLVEIPHYAYRAKDHQSMQLKIQAARQQLRTRFPELGGPES